MKKYPLLSAFVMLYFIGTAHSTVILFDNQATFDAEFPDSSRSSVGNDSSVTLLSSPASVDVYAQQASGDGTTTARESLYSVADNINYNFITTPITFTFSNVALSFPATGSTYIGYFGVFSGNSGGVTAPSTGPNDGVYFSLNRSAGALQLSQKLNGSTTTILGSWSLSLYSFTSLSMTLNGTTWSIVAVPTSGTTITASGNLTTAITPSNWGSNFYLGLESDQTTNDTTRFSELTMQSITIVPVPEPTELGLLGSGLAVLFILSRRRPGKESALN